MQLECAIDGHGEVDNDSISEACDSHSTEVLGTTEDCCGCTIVANSCIIAKRIYNHSVDSSTNRSM